MTPRPKGKQVRIHAFSLVELSIVLVILGLLTGGILAGQSLIRAAQLRRQMKDFETISTAHYTFRDKYLCMPGDCGSIAQFFPTVTNGNGDGRVDCWPASGTDECYFYFLSLENAGLIEPQRPSGGAPTYRRGFINNAEAYVHYQDRYISGGYTPATLLGSGRAWIHLMVINNPWANGSAMIPEEAWNMDTKLDDGRPETGKFAAVAGASGASYGTDCVASSQYKLDYRSLACRTFFKVE